MNTHTFDNNGYLVPHEITEMDWDTFEELFIFNHQRAELAAELRALISNIQAWQIEGRKIWVDGSFATLKPHPNDVDLVCFIDHNFYESNRARLNSIRQDFLKLDIYFVNYYPIGHPKHFLTNFDTLDWLHFLTRDRQNKRKGIVNLLLP